MSSSTNQATGQQGEKQYEARSEKIEAAVHLERFDVEDDNGKDNQLQASSAGNVVLMNSMGEIRRVPIPSSSPNDPLNFSKYRKLGILVCCCWFCKQCCTSALEMQSLIYNSKQSSL